MKALLYSCDREEVGECCTGFEEPLIPAPVEEHEGAGETGIPELAPGTFPERDSEFIASVDADDGGWDDDDDDDFDDDDLFDDPDVDELDDDEDDDLLADDDDDDVDVDTDRDH